MTGVQTCALPISLTFGGALVVTNLGGALANGDSFPLFNAANYAGVFNSLTLPALGANLFWNTNLLNVNGTLTVAAYLPPTISQAAIDGTNFVISGSGGIPGGNYYVLAATNLATPVWMAIGTNAFDASGNFSITLTNAVSAGEGAAFYRLLLQ